MMGVCNYCIEYRAVDYKGMCRDCRDERANIIGHAFGDYADLIVRKSKQERGRQPVRDTPLPSDSK